MRDPIRLRFAPEGGGFGAASAAGAGDAVAVGDMGVLVGMRANGEEGGEVAGLKMERDGAWRYDGGVGCGVAGVALLCSSWFARLSRGGF
jgi:hypothetical protein